MATGNTSSSRADSTGAPVRRAPEAMFVLGLISVLVIGGFAVFAWIASIG
ncbi:hypothetical protein [Roseomonas chloroacetimidivorans]|jgi:hypothetical protein